MQVFDSGELILSFQDFQSNFTKPNNDKYSFYINLYPVTVRIDKYSKWNLSSSFVNYYLNRSDGGFKVFGHYFGKIGKYRAVGKYITSGYILNRPYHSNYTFNFMFYSDNYLVYIDFSSNYSNVDKNFLESFINSIEIYDSFNIYNTLELFTNTFNNCNFSYSCNNDLFELKLLDYSKRNYKKEYTAFKFNTLNYNVLVTPTYCKLYNDSNTITIYYGFSSKYKSDYIKGEKNLLKKLNEEIRDRVKNYNLLSSGFEEFGFHKENVATMTINNRDNKAHDEKYFLLYSHYCKLLVSFENIDSNFENDDLRVFRNSFTTYMLSNNITLQKDEITSKRNPFLTLEFFAIVIIIVFLIFLFFIPNLDTKKSYYNVMRNYESSIKYKYNISLNDDNDKK